MLRKRKKLNETQIQHFFFLSEKLQNWWFLSAGERGPGGAENWKGGQFWQIFKKAEIRLKAEDSHPCNFQKPLFWTQGTSKHVNQVKTRHRKFWPKTVRPLPNGSRRMEVKMDDKKAWVKCFVLNIDVFRVSYQIIFVEYCLRIFSCMFLFVHKVIKRKISLHWVI